MNPKDVVFKVFIKNDDGTLNEDVVGIKPAALANYFDEKQVEDFFDYIPPQKTNQIFTPKKIVQKMVDMLEHENPGCFDMPERRSSTFT